MSVKHSGALVALALILAAFAPASAQSSPLYLTQRHDAARALRWDGVAEIAPGGAAVLANASKAAGAEHRTLVVRLGGARYARATIRVTPSRTEDLALQIVNVATSTVVARSDTLGFDDEAVSFTVHDGDVYRVVVLGSAGAPLAPQYHAAAWVRRVTGTNTGIARRLAYVKPNACGDEREPGGTLAPCYFKKSVPINVVFVGFDRNEVDEHLSDLKSSLPNFEDARAPTIKPVVLDESRAGGTGVIAREGGAQVRTNVLLQGAAISHLPFAYQYDFRFLHASESWSRRLFAAAKAATTEGEHRYPFDRAYLESYNARAAGLRRANPVLPGQKVDFIDAMKLEDWVARNPPVKGMTFDLSKPSQGYTFFVLDTYRPRYAGEYFRLDRYHNFRVMNSLTTDPDSKQQRGFDWGRAWGGRYRFMMLDVGAAPNAFEGSSQMHGSSERTAGDGDSSLHDPPIWEYTGCADPVDCGDLIPLFYQRLSENIASAAFLRFAPSYASRPRAADTFVLASHTWADANALEPARYDAAFVAARAKELLPAARITTLVRSKTLAADDAEQRALDESRRLGGSTGPVVRMMDSKRNAYAPDGGRTQAIPIVNVAHPAAMSWAVADAEGSVVARLGGDVWGMFNGVNAATRNPGFTASALRNLGRALGLFPPTEGIAYQREIPGDVNEPLPHPAKPTEQYRAYYRTLDWTFATTATPMASGWFYGRFEVLDKDAIGIAHSIDWLDLALDDVSDAFAALDAKRYTTIPKPVADAIMRAGKPMGYAVVNAVTGKNRDAVLNARYAKRDMEKVVPLALKQRRR